MTFTDSVSTEQVVVQGGVAATAVVFLQESVLHMVPYFIVAVVLIAVDLYFGIKAAMKRGETVRPSRALRRTVGKAAEYLAWIILSGTVGVVFETRAIEWIVLGLVMGNELLSVITNYFEIHGVRVSGLDIFKIVGDKAGIDTSEVKTERMPARDAKGRFTKKEEQ